MIAKKSFTIKAAVLMLALVLITSCFVGGTFAKYVTSGSGTDSARVAKFGVTVDVGDESMFKTEYNKDDATAADITLSVQSSNTDRLVAPGTGEEDALTFAVNGKPEVAVNVKLELTVRNDVFLKAGDYKDYTLAPYSGNFNMANDYYPVVFTLKKADVEVAKGNLEAIKTYLGTLSKNYAPNTDLTTTLGEYKLSWKWEFETNPNMDKADTLLGNLAADAAFATAGKWNAQAADGTGAFEDILTTDYSTNIDFDLAISVTQID